MLRTARTSEIHGLLWWLLGFCVVFVCFMPAKADFFPHYYWMFLYLSGSVVFVWIGRLVKGPGITVFALRLTALTVIMAFAFVGYHRFFNGWSSHTCNAAEYNYPTVLTFLLDPTDKEQINLAASCAKEGKNTEILDKLKAYGAE